MDVEEQKSQGIVSKFLHKSTMSYSTKVENWLKCIERSNSKSEDALSVASYSSCRSSDIEKKLERMFKTNDNESEKNPNKTERENNSEPSAVSGNILDILLTPVYDKTKQNVEMNKNFGSARRNLLPLFSESANNCDNVSNKHKYEHKLETPFVTSFIKANLNSEKSTIKNIVTDKVSNNQDLSSRTSQQTPESTFPEKELTQKFQGIREDEVLAQRSNSVKKIKRKLFSPEDVPYFAAKLNKSRTEENFSKSTRNEKRTKDNENNETLTLVKKKSYKYEQWRKWPIRKLTIDTNKNFDNHSSSKEILHKRENAKENSDKNQLSKFTEGEKIGTSTSFSENFNKESTTHSMEKISGNNQQLKKTANNKEHISYFDNSGKDKNEINDYTVQNEESQGNDNNKDRNVKFAKNTRYKTKESGKWPVKKRIVDTNYEKNLYNRNNQKIKEKKKIMPRENNYCNKNIEEKTLTSSTVFSDNFNNESTTQSLEDVNENNQRLKKITNNKEEYKEYIPHVHATLRNKLNNSKILNNEIDYHTLQNEECQTKDNKKETAVKNGGNKTKEREKWPVKKLTLDTNFEKNLLKQNNEEIKEKKKVTKEHNFSLKKNISEEISTPSKSFSDSFNKEISITHSLETVNCNTQQLKKVANNKEENKDYKEYIPHFDATVRDKFDNLNNEIDDYTVQNEESQINNNNQHTIGNGDYKTEERSNCPSVKKVIEVNTNFEENQNTQEIKEKIKVVTPGHNFNKNIEEETSATSTSSSKLFEEPSTSSGIKRKQPIEEVNPNNQKITKLVIDEHNYQKSETIIKPSKNIQIISKIVIRPAHNKCLCKENDFGKMMVGGFLNFLKHILQYHPDQVNASECVEIYNILKRCFAHN